MPIITVLGTYTGFAILFEMFPERFQPRLSDQPPERKYSLRSNAAFATDACSSGCNWMESRVVQFTFGSTNFLAAKPAPLGRCGSYQIRAIAHCLYRAQQRRVASVPSLWALVQRLGRCSHVSKGMSQPQPPLWLLRRPVAPGHLIARENDLSMARDGL